MSMEILTPSPPFKTQISSTVSFLSPTTASLTTLTKKTRYKFRKSHFKLFQNTPFASNSQLITCRFGKPTNRRNSLRKKLTHDLQVRQIPNNDIDPVHDFVDNNDSAELNFGNVKMGIDEIDSKPSNLSDKQFGESVLWNKLEGWVEQYKKDIEFWGIGSGPIFTVFQDSNGKVEKVLVDKDEILKRSGVDPLYFKEVRELKEFEEVNSKISHAKFLAKEMECGKDVISKNCSVAKFVVSGESSGWVSRIRSVSVPPDLVPKVSRVGVAVVGGFLFVWVMKKLFTLGGNATEVSGFEKEMLRRKMKARMEGEKLQKGSVEVIEEPAEPIPVLAERPHLDKEELWNSIRKAEKLNKLKRANLDVGGPPGIAAVDMDAKIQEIQMMARHARKIEREEDESDKQTLDQLAVVEKDTADSVKGDELEIEASDKLPEVEMDTLEEQVDAHVSNEDSTISRVVNGFTETETLADEESEGSDATITSQKFSEENKDLQSLSVPTGLTIDDDESCTNSLVDSHDSSNLSDLTEGVQTSDVSSSQQSSPKNMSVRRKPKIIRTVREAKEYLSQKNDRQPQVSRVPTTAALTHEGTENRMSQHLTEDIKEPESSGVNDAMLEEFLQTEQSLSKEVKLDELSEPTNLGEVSDTVPGKHASHDVGKSSEASKTAGVNACLDSSSGNRAYSQAETCSEKVDEISEIPKPTDLRGKSVPIAGANDVHCSGSEENAFLPIEINDDKDFRKNYVELQPVTADVQDTEVGGHNIDEESSAGEEKWLEKNFHEVEPIVKKIGAGFRNNYKVAREKVKQEADMELDFMKLRPIKNDMEFEWMQDDKLRDIVFRVRDNELSGRDPFHSMDPEDKVAFFKGLESTVEKENEKLSILHQWLHSNIENVDYGTDGISLYDSPEKVIPRWKGPPIDKIPEFLDNPSKQQEESSSLQKANESPKHSKIEMSHEATTKSRPDKVAKISKTVIETSDGSMKPGKKSGKEYWQHTKKWSRGFVDSYTAETDPEVKSVMKDVGKDLDRWITEKEIQDAADLMDKIPQKGKEYIEKKLNKLKREMELFGPAAVVSKYREYAEEKEEDYLWWLDLRYVLCIEMYTYEGEDQRVGFYSLEMAADLELEPKPHHVIAFEDPSDCKNLCYIIQAHLEMLGSGKAFVVAQPPKDVFQQAKANGFGVTVIRKGELQLNVDQPLEEVEESITEIGSKIYHDKMTRERGVDINSLMKGVFGISKPSNRRRKKRARKKPSKP